MFDAARAFKLVNELESHVKEIAAEMPELMPFARRILEPLMNGHRPEDRPDVVMQGKRKRTISEETRAKMRAAAAKRWGKKGKR